MDIYQQIIHKSRYSRWIEEEGRRENWEETPVRYIEFFKRKFPNVHVDWDELYNAIIALDVMPSMRALYTAGKALEKDQIAGFNCTYIVIDHPRSFSEVMYNLMCGAGVGFSVERQYVNKLPEISETFYDTDTMIVVKDSKIGWASSFHEILSLLWQGKIPKVDVSKVRPSGSPLKTFGGRASGPEPLTDLFKFSISMFKAAAGRKLTSLECHDLVTKTATTIIVGGTRRSATLSLSNLSDDRMRQAKAGQWWIDNPQRALANNSALHTEKPDYGIFTKEWLSLYESKSGERGIVNRKALKNQAVKFGRDPDHDFGVNPCGEIILRPQEACNLSEVIIRPDDTVESLKRKIRIAVVFGTLQASLTNLRYLRKIWKDNMEEEALLGVSLTGIRDNIYFSTPSEKLAKDLEELRDYAIDVNRQLAEELGIKKAASVTTVKPSGTISQLCNSSSGIHARYSKFYIRRIRNSKTDPLSQFLVDMGIAYETDVTDPNTYVFSFYQKSPDEAVTADMISAIDQLDFWRFYRTHWTTHNPSCTIYVKEHEWADVAAWVYRHFDEIGGLSFNPYSDHIYKQAPYEPISEEDFMEGSKKQLKEVDWDLLSNYEKEDLTTSSGELACVSGSCEVNFLS